MGQIQHRNSELVDLLSADFINCWMPIEQVVLQESYCAVTFKNIPQEFRTLVLMGQIRSDRSAEVDGLIARFNDDNGNNYDYVEASLFHIDTISTVAARGTSRIRGGKCDAANSVDDVFAPFQWMLAAYSRTDRKKWLKSPYGGRMSNLSVDANMQITLNQGLWEKLEPITSVTVFPEIGPNLVPGCILELYGIL